MLQYKKLIYIYFSTILLVLLIVIFGLYSYDPLQIFHKPWGRKITFHKNMRQQAAGIANNYKFDSIIIGSSILENTSAKEASEKLHGDFINISLSGSTYYERLIIMKHVFKKHSIKKVLYSLDAGSYIHQEKEYKGYPLKTFDYLYDKNQFNDLRAYFNTKYLKCLITFSKNDECIGENITLNRPNAWFDEEKHKIRYGGLSHWFKAHNSEKIKSALQDIAFISQQIKLGKKIELTRIDKKINKAKNYLDETIITFIKQHPTTEFIMVFPPYSRMHIAWWAQYDLAYFEIHKAVIQYLVQKTEKLKNLKVYGFENENFLDNIANYKDAQHYHYSINSWMLSQIAQNRGKLKKENIDQYLDVITKKALDFDMIKIGEKITNYLQTSSK